MTTTVYTKKRIDELDVAKYKVKNFYYLFIS